METLAPPAPQQVPEQDVVLNEQERQAANQMELRHQLENPDEMRILRNAVSGKTDEEAHAIVDQYFKFKVMSIDGPEMAESVNNMKPKYGEDVVQNVEHMYLDYLTMPDDQFESWAENFSKPAEAEVVDNSAAIEAEKAKLRFKYGEKTADAMGDDMLQKEAERNLGLNKPEATDESTAVEQPVSSVEAVQEPMSKEEATNLMDEQLKAFHMKVNERVDNNADLSVSEYTEMVNGLIAAFDKFAEAHGLSDEEKAKRLAILEKEVDRRKAQLDQYNEDKAVQKAEVNSPQETTEATETEPAGAEEETTKRRSLRDRWNSLNMRFVALSTGDIRGAFGRSHESQEAKRINKGHLIGAAALAGVAIFAIANHKNGWGFDINPFDGDGFDLNIFDKNSRGGAGLDINPFDGDGVDLNVNDNVPEVPADATSGVESAQTPELVNVQVDPGEGTSHIARDQLGINFETPAEWDQFNARTNPLFEGVDGFYQDAASGEWRVSSAGGNEVPRQILDEMQRVAEEIKNSRAA